MNPNNNEDPNKVVYFAETDARNRKLKFGIKIKDRSRHTYVIGKTGMGKSTLLENLAVQDIQDGRGLAFLDPHGKTADLLLEYVPEERLKDVLYFAPFDLNHPISFNVLEDVGPDKRHLVANGLMSAFKKIWVDAWSARMEYILNNILLALLEYPGSTLIGVNRILADEDYRKKVTEHITDPSVRAFWVDEFAKYGPKYMQEAGASIQNKIGQFISNPLIRNIIGQPKSTFDIRELMDEKKILIINLSKGLVGEANANLLGAMLITKIYLAAMSRADKREAELDLLPNFYLYVDEFQNFANESFADILSEARKYKLNLTVAHQYIEQMTEEVRAAVFGNVGTMITFRVGAYDAEVLEKEFAPDFMATDLVNLGFAQIYLKLMIDGVSSRPFSATTLAPVPKPAKNLREDIMENSRKTFARPRAEVENDIRLWHEETATSNAQSRGNDRNKKFNKESPIEQALAAVLGKAPIPKEAYRDQSQNQHQPKSAHTSHHNNDRGHDRQGYAPHDNRHSSRDAISHEIKKDPELDREKALRKAVSLSYLRQTNPKDKKEPTQEHLADLRSALASIMSDVKEKEGIKKEDVSPIVTPVVNITEDKKEEKEFPKESGIREIPEDVLKRILEIE